MGDRVQVELTLELSFIARRVIAADEALTR